MQISLEERVKRLSPDKFLGKVHLNWAEEIIGLLEGKRILDIGCGYGFLVNILSQRGFDGCGIDIDKEAIKVGQSLYQNIDLRISNAYELPFPDNSFDSVIFHEAIHHLDVARAIKEANRVNIGCLIIFDPNPNFILRLCRKLVRHRDEEVTSREVVRALKNSDYKITYFKFRDIFAMPLSGGFVGPQLCPDIPFLHCFLIKLDLAICRVLRLLSCQRLFCWRYIIKAKKTGGAI